MIDDPDPNGSGGLAAVTLGVNYDPSKFTVGSVTKGPCPPPQLGPVFGHDFDTRSDRYCGVGHADHDDASARWRLLLESRFRNGQRDEP